jgi:hypothetical protein
MIPTAPTDSLPTYAADDASPRYFVDDSFDANPADGDWWLDLGRVDLPVVPAV